MCRSDFKQIFARGHIWTLDQHVILGIQRASSSKTKTQCSSSLCIFLGGQAQPVLQVAEKGSIL